MAITRIFETSKRSLMNYQRAIDITARNIANVNVDGYTRRRVDLSTDNRSLMGLGQLGRQDVTRIRSRFVEGHLLRGNQDLNKYDTEELILTQVEELLGESADSGLSRVMGDFWNSWNDLANDPESLPGRVLVKNKAVIMTNSFNRLHNELSSLRDQVGGEISDKVSEVNRILNELGGTNLQIRTGGSDELLDKRDLLIHDLSNLMDINTRENSNGEVTIATGGYILVSGETVNDLKVTFPSDDGSPRALVQFLDDGHNAEIRSGTLGGLIEIYNERLPGYMDDLDTLAQGLASKINQLHRTGFSASGLTGVDFFSDSTSGAGDFRLSEQVLGNAGAIASSLTSDTVGDGSLAQAIADLQTDKFINGNAAADYYGSLLAKLGNHVQEASFLKSSQELVVQRLENQKAAVSGVALDEEMAKLIQYEQGYAAAARLASTVEKMMETVLTMV